MAKTRIGVLMGGRGIENEVSFNSGRTVCDHLDITRYETVPLFQKRSGELYRLPLKFLHRGKISDFEHKLEDSSRIAWDNLKTLVDFVFIALHGRYGEDGTLQGLLEILGIPYLGSKVRASAIGMDKIIQKEFLQLHGITVPRGIVVTPDNLTHPDTQKIILNRMMAAGISFPCIVKPHKEGSSLGVRLVHDQQALMPALFVSSNINAAAQQSILIEERITGMEFTCTILIDYKTNKPILLAPTEIIHEQGADIFDYDQKYMPGRAIKYTPARCRPDLIQKIHDVCLRVINCLEFTTMARIDGIVTKAEEIIILDPNSMTNLSPSAHIFKQASLANMTHPQLINFLIESELTRYALLGKV